VVGTVAWVMVAAAIYLYEVEKLGPMFFVAACAIAMFVVDFKMMSTERVDEQDQVEKSNRLALACLAAALAGLVAILVQKIS
jgi:hypothetical protein